MGLLDDIGNAVADVAEATGDFVEGAVNAAAEVCGDVVETAGNATQDGLNAVGGVLNGIPAVGGFLSGVCAWAGGIVAGVANFVAANVFKGAWGMIGGVLGGLIKIIGGLVTFHWDLCLEGLIDVVAGILGGLLSVLATFASLLQRLIPFINQDRALTKTEKDILKRVFRDSLALYNIRIKSTSGVPGTFTVGNTIYTDLPNLALPHHTLVHESTHAWQYQNLGYRYLVEALGAQAIYGRDPSDPCKAGNAYDWIGELDRGTTAWEHFNKEAAAQLIEEIWIDGTISINEVGTTTETIETGNGAFYEKPQEPEDLHFELTEGFIANAAPASEPDPHTTGAFQLVHCPRDGKDHTQLAIDSVKKLRSAWNFRLSQLIA